MAKYVNVEELLRRVSEEQNKLKSDDDRIWERNKNLFKGLAMVHALLRECNDVIDVNRCSFTQDDSNEMLKDIM